MHRVYEIFEVLPNGSPKSVAVISGLESAKARLHELANNTPNECFATDARTRQIVALLNVPAAAWRSAKHIFQVSYDEQSGLRRAELLKSRGFSVMSVIGNEAAKVALGSTPHCDLFIVGHAAPSETRQGIVFWLKAKYPKIKILALNPLDQQVANADYNARQDYPEDWLPIVSLHLGNSADQGLNKSSISGS